jgi:hypothetical protein
MQDPLQYLVAVRLDLQRYVGDTAYDAFAHGQNP